MSNLHIDTGPPEGLGARFVDRPRPRKPRPWLWFVTAICLAFLAGIWLAGSGDERPEAHQAAGPFRLALGQVVTIGTGDPLEGAAHLALSRDTCLRLLDLAVETSKGDEGVDRYLRTRSSMIERGQVFVVPSGTRGRVEEDDGSFVRVFVLEGEQAGKAGWVAATWAHALPR